MSIFNLQVILVAFQLFSELNQAILEESTPKKKFELLKEFSTVKNFFRENPSVGKRVELLEENEQYILYALVAIGQGELLNRSRDLTRLVRQVQPVEQFYTEIGGVIGYHLTCLNLLLQKDTVRKKGKYHAPKSIDIAKRSPEVQKSIRSAITHLPAFAEIYPVGGAADRLSLINERTGEFQIAATMSFADKSLLQRLVEDLQAREYLHWKLMGNHVSIPVVMMSSAEKNGSQHIEEHLKEKQWFGKTPDDFFLFAQPLVPTMTPDGHWQMKDANELLLKPGGHGVIWKLAKEEGAMDWLKKKGRSKAFIRQINNVIAGVDYGLLAFLGIGFDERKEFGFAGCPRLEGVSEGVNVVIETDGGYSLTNIEYCDLEHFQVEEEDLLANTNLLFADLAALERLVEKCPIPGMLVNAKKMQFPDMHGAMEEKEILRLESTMQNIADALVEEKMLAKTFITQNKRRKTISPIKKEFAYGSSMLQTPEQCYLDMLENAKDLLENECGFDVPSLRDPLTFFLKGPSFIFLYHPALGPQYEIIRQKLRGGRLADGAEVNLEIAEVDIEDLEVDGSLDIISPAVLGHIEEGGRVVPSDQMAKCTLKNVRILNKGINSEASRSFWKGEIIHKEKCEIVIEEAGEFYAEDVVIRGNFSIHVPSGVKVTLKMHEGKPILHHEVLQEPSWGWAYKFTDDDRVQLTRQMAK